jgi:hypothetical protein
MIKKIFLAPMSHCDPGYTNLVAAVLQTHVQHLRDVLALCKADDRYKWTCEEAWTVKVFLDEATTEEKVAFFHFVHTGQIEIGAFWGTLQFELPCEEELIRSCKYSTTLASREKFKIQCGIINDVPGIHRGIPEVLAGYEVPYLLWGPNTFRTLVGWTELPPLFYLQSQSGARVLVWHNNQDRRIAPKDSVGFGSEYGFGDMYVLTPYREMKGHANQGNASFEERGQVQAKGRKALDGLLERMEYDRYPYDAILLQCAADNRGPDRDILTTIDALNRDYSDLTFILATPSECFSYMENKYKTLIPSYSGDFIDSWSDGAGAMARTTAEYRQGQKKIFDLEYALARTGRWSGQDVEKIDTVYEKLLWYSEHTFGHSGWNWRSRPKDLLLKSWQDKADYVGKARQLLEGFSFLAKEADTKPNHDLVSDQSTLENRFYRISVSPQGQIQSILDKELNKELVDKGHPHPFNGLIFTALTGISETTPAEGSGKYDPIQTKLFIASVKELRVQKKSDRIELHRDLELSGPSISIHGQDTLILYSNLKRIDFVNTIWKQESPDKEAVYFSFPLNLHKDRFETWLEFPFHMVKFPEDLLSGSHSDFAGIQNFVAMADDDVTVTWLTQDAPLVQIGDIQTFRWAGHDYRPAHPTVFSYVMNNTWPTNFQLWQGGEFTFRYSLTSSRKFNPADAYKFKQQVMYPGITLPEIYPDNVVLTGLSLNDDKTFDLRFLEIAGRDGIGRFTWPGAQEARPTNLTGVKADPLPFCEKGTFYFPYSKHRLININVKATPQ